MKNIENSLKSTVDETNEEELHTCSSDEKLKTGEVTLENPFLIKQTLK